MIITKIFNVEPLIFMLTLISANYFPVAKPSCLERCGNVSIPFPFGTTENCYGNSSFYVTCNQSSNPPKLFMQDSTIEITEISLDGQLKILQFVASNCYFPNGTQIFNHNPFIQFPFSFTVNYTANKFTILGCDSYGYISGHRGNRDYLTGCTATCTGLDDLTDGSCGGLGCCQSSIPKEVWRVDMDLSSYDNHVNVSDFNNCSYGFLAELSAFTFSPENLTNFENVEMMPMVVDWAIGNETCESARTSPSSYACKSPNSECYKPDNGYGYRCQCEPGYEGNPYLDDGCQDIDECNFANRTDCAFQCVNTRGSFKCECPKGYLSDGKSGCKCPGGYSGVGIREGGCTRESGVYKHIADTALGIILVMLVICLVYFELNRRRSKKMKDMFFLQNGGMLLQEKLRDAAGRRETSSSNGIAKIFSSTELVNATNNFHSSMIIGQGGFGIVYKGLLEDKRLVAIKKPKQVDPTQIEQFINEVVVLSQISHRNVVKLLGCCLETQVPFLVYEFVDNGTLSDHIHNQATKHFLDWNARLNIAIETADVLWYLHSAASTPIIHRDVKSANILLDHNFTAKVADFGASRLVPIDQTQLSTMVQGTFGYLDPEYMQTNQLTEKSDVYSFGVVLVELITGKKAISYDRPEEERILTNFFLCALKQGRLFEVVDDSIVADKANWEQLSEVAKLAKGCLNVKGEDRPSMKQVAMKLEGLRFGDSPAKFEQSGNSNEIESFRGEQINCYVNVDGYSKSIGYDSLMDHTKLYGGR